MWKHCLNVTNVLVLLSLHVGTSLLQEVVFLVSQGADPDEIGLMNIDEQLPVIEYPQPGLDVIQVQLTSDQHSMRTFLMLQYCMLRSIFVGLHVRELVT